MSAYIDITQNNQSVSDSFLFTDSRQSFVNVIA